jgi:hypothetical protein
MRDFRKVGSGRTPKMTEKDGILFLISGWNCNITLSQLESRPDTAVRTTLPTVFDLFEEIPVLAELDPLSLLQMLFQAAQRHRQRLAFALRLPTMAQHIFGGANHIAPARVAGQRLNQQIFVQRAGLQR